MNAQPKYRSDIKGQVKSFLEDFKVGVKGEVENSASFTFPSLEGLHDLEIYQEYKDYLTEAEMLRVLKSVMGQELRS